MKLLLIISLFIFAYSQERNISNRAKDLTTTGELHANNVKAIVSNNGWLFWGGGASGFVTPSPVFEDNSGNFATVFSSGLFLVGKVNNELRASVAHYSTDFIPGDWDEYQSNPLLNGIDNPKYKIYYYYSADHIAYLNTLLLEDDPTDDAKIHAFAKEELLKATQSNLDWSDAILQGAPTIPPGDVAAYTIYHDSDISHRENNGLNENKDPLNVQIRQLLFSYRSDNAVNNAVFAKLDIINMNDVPIEDLYISIWSDPDVGQYNDDLIGSDPELQLAYAYNALQNDAQYTSILGIAPPATGQILLQGPIVDSVGHSIYKINEDFPSYLNELPQNTTNYEIIENKYVSRMTGLYAYMNGTEAQNAQEYLYFANNLTSDGSANQEQILALQTALITEDEKNFFFSGDPVNKTGWIGTRPNNIKYTMNMDPITLDLSNGNYDITDPGFTSIIFASYNSFGDSHIQSVAKLKFDAFDILQAFNYSFESFEITNPAPELSYTSSAFKIRLFWKATEKENISTEQKLENGYKFEGYQIVQFKDENRDEFIQIDVQDVKNNVSIVYNKALATNSGDVYRKLFVAGNDQGISYSIEINKDYYTGKALRTNNIYHYAVRAYYYNPEASDQKSFGKFGEWSQSESLFVPKKIEIGSGTQSYHNELINFHNSSGIFEGNANIRVLNPYELTGKDYKIKFKEYTENTFYSNYPNDTIPKGTLAWYIENDGQQISKLIPQTYRERINNYPWSNDIEYPLIIDGLKITVTGPDQGIKSFTIVSNANGTLDPPDMAAFAFNNTGFPLVNGSDRPNQNRQQTNKSTWGIHIATNAMSDTNNVSYDNFIKDLAFYMGGIDHEDALAPALDGGTGIHHAGSNEFEIRFTDNASKALLRYDNSRHIIDVPFELWNIGPDPSDQSDDYRMIPFIDDQDGNHLWNLRAVDHKISSGSNDPATEGITFLDPTNKTTGQAGYNEILAVATTDLVNNWENSISSFPEAYNSTYHTVGFNNIAFVNWNGGEVNDINFPANIDAEKPENGSVFRISMNKATETSTELSFRAPNAPERYKSKLSQSLFKEHLTVFPNPYNVSHSNQKNLNDRYITFANLPVLENNESIDIRIYSLNGNLVKTIKYQGQSTLQRWELDNNSNRKVNSGLYIAVLKYRNTTVTKKILVFM